MSMLIICSQQRTTARKRWFETVEKVLTDFSAETSALRALIVGVADNSHTGADRSYFSDAHVVGKID